MFYKLWIGKIKNNSKGTTRFLKDDYRYIFRLSLGKSRITLMKGYTGQVLCKEKSKLQM